VRPFLKKKIQSQNKTLATATKNYFFFKSIPQAKNLNQIDAP
jgi:hypothetical protein